jgi:Fungal Zn(2)-Cys(6) binuclear cluster domain
MPLPPPPPRRKACDACVRAKRRCDLGNPCKRCTERNTLCLYPPPPSTTTTSNTPQDTDSIPSLPILPPSFPDSPQHNPFPNVIPAEPTDWIFPYMPEMSEVQVTNGNGFSTPSMSLEMIEILQQLEPRDILDRERVIFGTRQLRRYPEMLVNKGCTPFLHRHLYHDSLPSVISDLFGVCALYCSKKSSNYESIMWRIIEANINRLFEQQERGLPFLLAKVQALVLYQVIRLFDGDIRQRALAEQQDTILEQWTKELKDRTLWDSRSENTWEQWVFAESSRRTVIASLTMRGIFLVIKQGYCSLAPIVTELSFTANAKLWNVGNAYEWSKLWREENRLTVAQMKFEELFRCDGGDLEEFGMLMMVIYNGVDFVNEWLDRNNYPALLPADYE